MGYYQAGKFWKDETLWEYAKGKKVTEVKVKDYIHKDFHGWNIHKLSDMTREFRAIQNADMSYPILVSTGMNVMDGCHRLVKADLDGIKTIKAIVLDPNSKDFPKPDYDEWEAVQKAKQKNINNE